MENGSEVHYFVWLQYSDALHSCTEAWAARHADTRMYEHDIFFAVRMEAV